MHNSRSHCAGILFNTGCTLGFSSLIERKVFTRSRWKLIQRDSTLAENFCCNGDCRHRIPPTRIKREMRDDLGYLTWLDAIVESEAEMGRHLDRLITRNQGCHGNDAAVTWR